jgi:hypothetical protein
MKYLNWFAVVVTIVALGSCAFMIGTALTVGLTEPRELPTSRFHDGQIVEFVAFDVRGMVVWSHCEDSYIRNGDWVYEPRCTYSIRVLGPQSTTDVRLFGPDGPVSTTHISTMRGIREYELAEVSE